jgi:RNA polymerase sigma-70 factor, ECF subfamily
MCGASPVSLPAADPDTATWVADLSAGGPATEAALRRLHPVLLRVARSELHRRNDRIRLRGPELDDLAHQAADDALLGIIAKLGTFRAESRFTTWAFAFVIHEVSSKIGRHFWRRPPVALDADEAWTRLPDRFHATPDEHAEFAELLHALRRAVDDQLTHRQREVFVAIAVQGIPLDALVERMGTNRNALYKAVFDARRKLRAALVAGGYLGTVDAEPGGMR